jgi:peptidyl-prolyl cis-trans isomerase SurA
MVSKSIGWSMALLLLMLGNVRAELVDRVVAVVNNDIILHSDVEQALSVAAATLDQQHYSPSQKQQILNEQRQRILDQLIYDKLTDQQVERNHIKIDDDEVNATIERIRSVNKMSDQDLRRALELDGISYDDYRKQIKERLLRTRLVNREVKSKIVITDEDVKAYYDSHQREYGGQTKLELSHILIRVAPTADPAEKERALNQIKDIYKRLQNGETFEKLATQHSEAPSAQRSGYLGVFDISQLSDQIQQAVKKLGPQQFSEVVETDQGYQIFYIASLTQSGAKPLEKVRAEIQEKIYTELVDQKFNAWIKDLRQRSHIQIMGSVAASPPATSSP